MSIKKYCLGFAFVDNDSSVILIRKEKGWQKGMLNGIGGLIENDETPWNAMVREFKEETDIDITTDQLNHFGSLVVENECVVYLYRIDGVEVAVGGWHHASDEGMAQCLYLKELWLYDRLPNLEALIHTAKMNDGFSQCLFYYGQDLTKEANEL